MAATVMLQGKDQGGLRIQTSYNVPKSMGLSEE